MLPKKTFKRELYNLIAQQQAEDLMSVLHTLQEAVCYLLWDCSSDKLALKLELDRNVNQVWAKTAERYEKIEAKNED